MKFELFRDIPGIVREYVVDGLALADVHARARGLDAATPGQGRGFVTALSLAALHGRDHALTIRKAATDGADLLKVCDADGLKSVSGTLRALSQARLRARKQQDAIGLTETLAQVGKVYDPAVNTPTWEHWAPVREVPEFGRNEYVSVRMEASGDARPSADMLDNGDSVDLNTTRRSTRIAYFTVKTSEDPLTLAQASIQGLNHGRVSDMAARMIIRQRMAHYLLYSEAAYNWDGALAITDNTVVTGDATALASATVAETVDGIKETVSSFEAAQMDGLSPNRGAIAQKIWTKLAGRIGSADRQTGREHLMATFPDIEWKPAVYLNDLASFDGGTNHALILSHVGDMGIHAVAAEEPMVIGYQDGIHTRSLYVRGFAGLHWFHRSNIAVGKFAV